MFPLLLLCTFTSLVLAASRVSPPSVCLIVNKSGSGHRTVQSAVEALSKDSTSAQCIFIYQGTYYEQVYVPVLKSALTVYGYTRDTSSYTANEVTITQSLSQDNVANNDLTATLRAHTPNLRVYNINLVNTRGKGSQALALSAQADRQAYYAVQFHGYQDTILANKGMQLYARCLIVGATDFIFGQTAAAWFEKADIRVLAASTGYITANGRDSDVNPSFYVISNSNIAAASGNVVPAGAYYLGRPWRNYSRVVFQTTSMSDVVNSAGWRTWNTDDPRTDRVYYGEYKNTGTGSKGTRASFAKMLNSPVAVESILGTNYKDWVDGGYFP
ncbi:carbohydrate esterase family 8 protein [Sporormia fimetaria CBS 119925]|uniref:Pectinesterase n=1 Tax=Sporormia fimetaria CBS 119925 TaxID=1340428 RepID=A0A6A6V4Q3_9PLEO|nr:carbohydrate esterase family 8 protein [Sporormia fimetaria CBS 119925]